MCKIMTGLIMGAVCGTLTYIVIFPNLDRKTQRTLKRSTRKLKDSLEDAYDSLSIFN
ncbi:MAG: YtxH domain-containing protein [Clostridium sp.]